MVGGTTQPENGNMPNTNKIARQRDFEPKMILAKVLLQWIRYRSRALEWWRGTAEDGIEGCVRDDDDQDRSGREKCGRSARNLADWTLGNH